MIKLIVIGAAGRMGQRIISLALSDKDFKLVGAIDAVGSPMVGKDVGGVRIQDDLQKIISSADVVIDFSHAEATIANLQTVLKHGKKAVVGTTGHSEVQKKSIQEIAKKISVVMAPNMSIGVNVLWKIVEEAARAFGSSMAVHVKDVHHIHKKDKPSGTALEILRVLSKALGIPPEKIPVEALREGEVVGDHTVTFEGSGEILEIKHHAISRDTFAEGALRAAKWLAQKDKKPGFYTMKDILCL